MKLVTEDLIMCMKEIIRCYEICNSEYSPTNREITFWREKYLADRAIINPAFFRAGFLYIPSESIMDKTNPVEFFEKLIKGM